MAFKIQALARRSLLKKINCKIAYLHDFVFKIRQYEKSQSFFFRSGKIAKVDVLLAYVCSLYLPVFCTTTDTAKLVGERRLSIAALTNAGACRACYI